MPTDLTVPADFTVPSSRHRISRLLGAQVVLPGGVSAGVVKEVRLRGGPGLQTYVVEGLIVGSRPQGGLLGYDRREVRGPWLVRAAVRLVNRDLGYVPWRSVRRIGWDDRVVEVGRVDPLTEERAAA
jgi:sporulation protein YlmC with PRC-barrel domain